MATMTRQVALEKMEAIAQLREWMPRGTTVYTILRHVSRSGMQREISLVLLRGKNGEMYPVYPNHAAAKALGWRLGKEGIKVNGCGMDMGFHLVHSISSVLYGQDKDGKYSHDGAYALKQRWL